MERTGSLRGYQRVDKKVLARGIKIYLKEPRGIILIGIVTIDRRPIAIYFKKAI
jgi:hypothetical protein